jgi:hypothetical protein
LEWPRFILRPFRPSIRRLLGVSLLATTLGASLALPTTDRSAAAGPGPPPATDVLTQEQLAAFSQAETAYVQIAFTTSPDIERYFGGRDAEAFSAVVRRQIVDDIRRVLWHAGIQPLFEPPRKHAPDALVVEIDATFAPTEQQVAIPDASDGGAIAARMRFIHGSTLTGTLRIYPAGEPSTPIAAFETAFASSKATVLPESVQLLGGAPVPPVDRMCPTGHGLIDDAVEVPAPPGGARSGRRYEFHGVNLRCERVALDGVPMNTLLPTRLFPTRPSTVLPEFRSVLVAALGAIVGDGSQPTFPPLGSEFFGW